MQKIATTILRITGGIIALGLAGCYVPVNGKSNIAAPAPSQALPKPGPHEVLVDSRWAYSATENRPAPEWILQRAGQLVAEGNPGLDKLVRRWPDVALEFLRESIAVNADVPQRLALAESYDRVTLSSDPKAGWSGSLTASDSQRETYDRFRVARENVLSLFKSGQFAQATKINLPSVLPSDAPPALRIEALRLAGLAMLLDNKPDRAGTFFALTMQAAAKGPRHQQFELGLLASEAQRRAGQTEASIAAWKTAVVAGTNIRDPELWERAILAKPDHIDWPAEATITGVDDPNFAVGTAPDTANVLIGVGKMYLSREALQPALLAFSRAEAETAIPGEKALAGLYRAQSMIAMQQGASALPMLEGLLACGDPRIAHRAQAVQGDVLCRVLDDHQHGIPIMREGLNADSTDWPGKARLVANLGLYEILDGRQEEGLQLLHGAQAHFEASGQWEDLAESLKNEAASLQVAGKKQDAELVQNHADAVSRKAGLPTGPLIAVDSTPTQSNPLALPR